MTAPETGGLRLVGGTEVSPAVQATALLEALWLSPRLHHQLGAMPREHLGQSFRNVPVDSIPEAVAIAVECVAGGEDVYHACAEYTTSANRRSDNVESTCAFWMDIDCGEQKAKAGKGYTEVSQAAAALDSFCCAANLPSPTHIVNSGGGLHVYWVVNAPIERSIWQEKAAKFKAVAERCGLMADRSRTSDIASVLRLPGTLNHKYVPARPVSLQKAAGPLDRDELLALIDDTYARLCPSEQTRQPDTRAANDDSAEEGAIEQSYGPPDVAKLTSALAYLDPDCDEATWKLRRLAPLARAARTYPEWANELKELAKKWSRGDLQAKPSSAWVTPGASSGRTGAEIFEATWRRFLQGNDAAQQSTTTLGTVYHDADRAGWAYSAANTATSKTPRPQADGQAQLEAARTTLAAVVEKVKAGDVGAPLEPESVAGLRLIAASNAADYQRLRNELKTANKNVSLVAIDSAVKLEARKGQIVQTHHGYAENLIARLTSDGWKPVGHEGTLYVIDPGANIWIRKDQAALEQLVAESYDDGDNCRRRADYTAIALHATSLVADDAFFAAAPVGLACPGGFYRIVGGSIRVEPLKPGHRQRVLVDVTPSSEATPQFDAFLHDTFKSETEREELEQIELLQEVAGAIVLGFMHRYQKAVVLYDPYGRAGKGTFESILRHLVPASFVTAVSPFTWEQEYFAVALAGARLNVVGELPDDRAIPAAIFKSVIGGDLITGRHPTHRPDLPLVIRANHSWKTARLGTG